MQKLLLKGQIDKLISNGQEVAKTGEGGHLKPVVKLFSPTGGATWLITEMEEDGDTLFGLCDLGLGMPELGRVSLTELKAIKGPFGLGIERDMYFEADRTIEEYAADARNASGIAA